MVDVAPPFAACSNASRTRLSLSTPRTSCTEVPTRGGLPPKVRLAQRRLSAKTYFAARQFRFSMGDLVQFRIALGKLLLDHPLYQPQRFVGAVLTQASRAYRSRQAIGTLAELCRTVHGRLTHLYVLLRQFVNVLHGLRDLRQAGALLARLGADVP